MGLARGTPGWINRARVSKCLMAGTGGRVGGARERWGGREAENGERLQGRYLPRPECCLICGLPGSSYLYSAVGIAKTALEVPCPIRCGKETWGQVGRVKGKSPRDDELIWTRCGSFHVSLQHARGLETTQPERVRKSLIHPMGPPRSKQCSPRHEGLRHPREASLGSPRLA